MKKVVQPSTLKAQDRAASSSVAVGRGLGDQHVQNHYTCAKPLYMCMDIDMNLFALTLFRNKTVLGTGYSNWDVPCAMGLGGPI